jgi:hypothetical protein
MLMSISLSCHQKEIFRPDVNKTMQQLASFLNNNGSPFVINISPFLNIYQNKIFQQIMPSLKIRLIHWLMGRMFTTITLMEIWIHLNRP